MRGRRWRPNVAKGRRRGCTLAVLRTEREGSNRNAQNRASGTKGKNTRLVLGRRGAAAGSARWSARGPVGLAEPAGGRRRRRRARARRHDAVGADGLLVVRVAPPHLFTPPRTESKSCNSPKHASVSTWRPPRHTTPRSGSNRSCSCRRERVGGWPFTSSSSKS